MRPRDGRTGVPCRRDRLARILAPLLVGALVLTAWEIFVRVETIPPYILPGPLRVADSLIDDWGALWPALLVTIRITMLGLALAALAGLPLAVLLTQSRWAGLGLLPYALALRIAPAVAIAPLILIYIDNVRLAVLACVWIAALFPILTHTIGGLNSADRNLLTLHRLYGATRWQILRHLRLPAAMPGFLAGLRIAGGTALLGGVTAEFAAGAVGTSSGLAYRILEAGYRLEIPRLFAALLLICLTGIVIFLFFTLLQHLILRRWPESAAKHET